MAMPDDIEGEENDDVDAEPVEKSFMKKTGRNHGHG